MPTRRELLEIARDLRLRLPSSTSLDDVSVRAGWSAFHLHRAFTRFMGETPKQFVLRLRLERAGARLATTRQPIRRVALEAGFGSHEVFTRAFRRHFGSTPLEYRRRALRGVPAAVRARHVEQVAVAGPCVRLHHVSLHSPPRRRPMTVLSIERRDIAPQPIVFVRLKTSRSHLAVSIGQGLGRAFGFAQQHGLGIVGPPLVRYVEMGIGTMTIDTCVPVAVTTAAGDGVESGTLAGGAVAVALHGGAYEQLPETHAAMERWIEERGLRPNGAAWESYLTDPADVPDPANWRTEVYWPVA